MYRYGIMDIFWGAYRQIKNPIGRGLEKSRRRIIPFRKFGNEGSVEKIVYGLMAYMQDNKSGKNTPILRN